MVLTNTMDVSLNRVGHLIVQDKANVLDIDTTARQVRRDQNIRFATAQRLECRLTLLLVLPRVEGCRTELGHFVS